MSSTFDHKIKAEVKIAAAVVGVNKPIALSGERVQK